MINCGKSIPPLLILGILSLAALRCSRDTSKMLPVPSGLPLPPGWQLLSEPGQVNALALRGSALWAGTTQGLYRIDTGSPARALRMDAGEQVSHVRSLQFDSNGVLWIGHVNGLARWDGERFRYYTESDGLPFARVNSLALDHGGHLLIGTGNGLARLEGDRIVAAPENPGLASPVVSAILADGSGNLWVASNSDSRGGLARLRQDGGQVFRVENGLAHSYVNDLILAQDGTVWAATGFLEFGGICVFGNESGGWRVLRTIGTAQGLTEPNVRSVMQDRDGDFWIGFENRGAALLSGSQIRRLTPEEGFPSMDVPCSLQGSDGTVWMGTVDGILMLNPQAVEKLKGK